MKKYYIYIFLMIGLGSCQLDYQPLDKVANTTYWQTTNDVEKAVNRCYARLVDTDRQAFISCATDDSYSWSNWPNDVQYVANGSASSTTGEFSNSWNSYYKTIAYCNDVLDNADKVKMDAATLNRYKAEARVIRAYHYILLTELYGDVPLITHIQSIDEFYPKRTPKADVAAFVISELQDITTNKYLPNTWDNANKGRMTQGAALGLLAREALYNGQWKLAADASKNVMNLGVYGIDPSYLSLFDGTNKNSREIIMAAQCMKDVSATAWATWLGGPSLSGWSQVVPLKGLVDAYECTDGMPIDKSPLYDANHPFQNRDPRLALSIIIPGTVVNGTSIDVTSATSIDRLGANNASLSGYYYKKTIPADIGANWWNNSYNDIVLMRYAEVLLTYAEAKIELNQIDASVLSAINEVRQRPGVSMPAVITSNQSGLREIVRRERRVEFPLEGLRLSDIRRWKIAQTVMNGPVYGIFNNYDKSRADYGKYVKVEDRTFNPNRDYLWSLPSNELSLNKNLVNNAGW